MRIMNYRQCALEELMSKQRLNLTVDAEVIEHARRYSERNHTSISHLVGDFLASLPGDESTGGDDLTPTVRRLVGVAKGGPDRSDYRRRLVEKHTS
jgi:hypothetical protein